jgi:UDP-GlcNAc:undecaprenyl-phosphate GlcNAc-1-phosphate transferase
MNQWYFIYALTLSGTFALSVILTAIVRKLAIRWDLVDHPGERKVHTTPMPLMGGVAICLSFYAVIFAGLLLVEPVTALGFDWLRGNVLFFLGEDVKWKLIGIFTGGIFIFLLGVVDDIVALRPETKLVGQIASAAFLVACGVRVDLFLDNVWIASAVTVFWVVLMTNSLNFLDNMDGLCGGVSVVSAFSFFLCLQGETFICVLLMVFAGAVSGFLYHNLSPARIFMGDAGSMFCGYMLATVAVLGTFYTEESASRAVIAAPLLALSVPLFDTFSVIYIRWRNGESLMKGDKRHFSHRLVDLGMSNRQAVEFIFLVAAVVGLGAAMLPRMGALGASIIVAQTIGVFSLIVILMNVANRRDS